MKNLVILMLAMSTSLALAQRPNQRRPDHQKGPQMAQLLEELTAEQIAQLETKKLTLALDLNDSQQAKMLAVQTQVAQDRKADHAQMQKLRAAGKTSKPTAQQRYEKMDATLSKKILVKKQIKEILTADQYEKWEKIQHGKRRAKKAAKGKRR